MSKATAAALSGLKRRAQDRDVGGLAAAQWRPAGAGAEGVDFEWEEGSGDWLVNVAPGVSAKWVDVVRDGSVEVRVVLGAGASLTWLVGRALGAAASSRRVGVQMREGSRLLLAEAFELGVDDCHGESITVEMGGAGCHAELAGRWAQGQGSQLCQETLGVIGKEGAKSFFGQSSKTLKKGCARLALLEPNLRVEVDEARANHGAAHGQVDELSMHALMSRGLGREEAGRLVVAAFLGHVWTSAGATEGDLARLGWRGGDSWS